MTTVDNGVKHFSSRRQNVHFYIDDEMFEAFGAAPADFMENLANSIEGSKGSTGMEAYNQLKEAIGYLLVPESATRLAERRASFANPVTLGCMTEVATFLMTELSGNPTQPPSPSATSPEVAGETSTDGAPAEATTP